MPAGGEREPPRRAHRRGSGIDNAAEEVLLTDYEVGVIPSRLIERTGESQNSRIAAIGHVQISHRTNQKTDWRIQGRLGGSEHVVGDVVRRRAEQIRLPDYDVGRVTRLHFARV